MSQVKLNQEVQLDLNAMEDVDVVFPGEHQAVFTKITQETKEEGIYYNFYFTLDDGTEKYWSRAHFNRRINFQGRTFDIVETEKAKEKIAVATNKKKISEMVNIPLIVVINDNRFISDVKPLKKEEKRTFAE